MFQYRQVLVRLRQGDTDRDLARSGLMGRRNVVYLSKRHYPDWFTAVRGAFDDNLERRFDCQLTVPKDAQDVDINILCHLISAGAREPAIGAHVTVWFLMIIFYLQLWHVRSSTFPAPNISIVVVATLLDRIEIAIDRALDGYDPDSRVWGFIMHGIFSLSCGT